MRLAESQVLKRVPITLALLVAVGVTLVSCGTYSAPSGNPTGQSGLKFRAFVSNPLRPITTGTAPVLEIIDAAKDVFQGFVVAMPGSSPQPGLMAVSPNKKLTLVSSASNNAIAVVTNANESAVGAIALPGPTESMLVGIDNSTGYAAVRNAAVLGQPTQGAVEVLNLSAGTISATVGVPSAHYIVASHNGNRILAFGDNQNTVTIIAPSLVGTSTDPRTIVCPDGKPQPDLSLCPATLNPVFDHPVWGVFSSDDTTAYILNCGPECGNGTSAGVTVLDMNTNTAGAPLAVDAATIGLLSGTTLYVAGTPKNLACTSGTAAPTCGTLDVVDLGSMTVTSSAEITDGHHTHMEMGANGQLFIGALTCSNVHLAPSGSNPGETRGCLSIFNTTNSKVVVSTDNGDVTGIQPIAHRSVVYVVEDGELRIYDTSTDKLQSTQIDLIGQAIDVKVVDF
jgi:WD40 repeat protein